MGRTLELQPSQEGTTWAATIAREEPDRVADTPSSSTLQHQWAEARNIVHSAGTVLGRSPERAEVIMDTDLSEIPDKVPNRQEDPGEPTQEVQGARAPMAEETSPWTILTTA